MEGLRVILDLEKTGFVAGTYDIVEHSGEMVVGGMQNGTASGKPVVMVALVKDEHILVKETTLALFLTAADALKAKYGDPR